MFTCRIENGEGNILTLTQNESNFQVIQIDGLNPPDATINMSTIAGMDGARYNSAKLETRNLVIYIKLNNDVERNRIMLYRFFPTKKWCKFYYKNESRDVYIECYAQKVEVSPFSDKEIMQISLICPQPYFNDMEEAISYVSKELSAFSFPFSININQPIPVSTYNSNRVTVISNDSESETGLTIEVDVLGTIAKILLRNTVTGESFVINNTSNFINGDKITITTYRGNKSVTLTRNGTKSSLFSKLQAGFTFFQLSIGNNYISYQIDNGTNDHLVKIMFKYRSMYRGV